MTLDELAGKNFASTTEAAQLLDGADPRTIRRMAERGEIPSRRVGTRIMIPVAWLREYLGDLQGFAAAPAAEIDPEQLADLVADRVMARMARIFGSPAT
jgi:excisionase family DNA binding protein